MRIVLFFVVAIAPLVFLSNKGGRNQPTTGAPFENSSPACGECHSGGNFTPALSLTLKDTLGNVVNAYQPNQNYTLEMQVSSSTGSPKGYGFQAVLVDEANVQAGSFVSLGDKVRKLTLQNRVYLTQISPITSGLFTARWKAPAEAKNLKLYIAGLVTNSNGSTSGDKGTFTSFPILPSITSQTEEAPTWQVNVSVSGNTLSWDTDVQKAEVIDLSGRRIAAGQGSSLTLPAVSPGFYVLQLQQDGQRKSIKFVF